MREKISFATMKAQPILAKFGEIEVYDINCKVNQEIRIQFIDALTSAIQEQLTVGTEDIDLTKASEFGHKLLLKIFPILTNFTFDGMTEEEVSSVFEEPSPTLVEVNKVISTVVGETLALINDSSELENQLAIARQPKTSKEELLRRAKEEEKSRKKAALLKQMEELDSEIDSEDGE